MPGETDDQRDDLMEDEDLDTGDEEGETEDGDTGDDGSEASAPKGEAKRIADLMSKAQREEARANKAEAALKASRDGTSANGSKDPATRALMVELREASLDAVFGEYPELREYSIDRSLIEGTTRAEMREAASSLVSLIKNVTTKARNKALADAGVKVEPLGATRKPPKSAAEMSDEEFLKMLDRIS